MPSDGLSLGMVAGEKSGDLLAGAVLAGLRERRLVDARGVGGPAMQARGFDAWWSIDALSVMGFVDVLKAYPRLLRLRNRLRDRLIAWHPRLFVGVDAPDFNFGLEIALRERGVRVAHFISPSIWAWRRERIDTIRKAVDHMLLVFPFEESIYREAGIPATFVGHPLADVIDLDVDAEAARRRLALPDDRTIVALLPGSRQSEIAHLAEPFIETAAWLARRRPDLHFVLPAANETIYQALRQKLAAMALPSSLSMTLMQGQAHEAMAACQALLVASGTATLEAALFKRPMVIAYKLAWLNYRIMRGKGYLPWIGLPNILCNESIVPEFVQQAATPEAMGTALLEQLESPAQRARVVERFGELHLSLRRGCAQRAAEVLDVLAGTDTGAGGSR
ncbi:MAG: lipid-A-disaccharide synthase [Burkholderiaceae bacterium]